jgi:hypothetical protein
MPQRTRTATHSSSPCRGARRLIDAIATSLLPKARREHRFFRSAPTPGRSSSPQQSRCFIRKTASRYGQGPSETTSEYDRPNLGRPQFEPLSFTIVRREFLLRQRAMTFQPIWKRSPNRAIRRPAMRLFGSLRGNPGNVPCRREADRDNSDFLQGRDIDN